MAVPNRKNVRLRARAGVVAALAALVLAAPRPCRASFILLDTEPATAFRRGEAQFHTSVSNRGDETAFDVQVEAALGDSITNAPACAALEVDATCRSSVALGSAPLPPGTYNVCTRVRYSDRNGYPYSQVGVIPLVTGEPDMTGRPALELRMESAVTGGRLSLSVSSHRDVPLRADIRLVLPDELGCRDPRRSLLLPPGGTTTTGFAVTNRWARPGSVYEAVVVADVGDKRRHDSFTTTSYVTVPQLSAVPRALRGRSAAAIALALGALTVVLEVRLRGRSGRRRSRIFACLLIAAVTGLLMLVIPPRLLLLDTLAVGGDTPAHNYLASHLRAQLFGQGRLVSWCDGWWCGFPAFQFYFCLPYALIALLSVPLPFNAAFKIVSVLGVYLLPLCAYTAGRRMRLPRPGPELLCLAVLPLLFDPSHTMWGVNIYSTLAGMIANSISFCVMLLFLACAVRDADDGRVRLRTVLLLTALGLSHFFTSVVAGLCVAFLPLLRPHSGARRAFAVLAAEALLAGLLLAWWLVPLVARRDYAIDFGNNWDIKLPGDLPPACLWAAPLAALGLVTGLRKGDRWTAILAVMLIGGVVLFVKGQVLAPVFDNVRLWPFIVFAVLALAAGGTARLLGKLRFWEPAVAAILVVCAAHVAGPADSMRAWAEWNYTGMQNKPRWKVFEELVSPLRDTPGRLANDLHPANHVLGSSRIFEVVPHLTGKPVLEGGIVNSAAGSLFSYYIQSETSRNCAGYPPLVQPGTFDMTNATRHLELFNVKHFVARWEGTRRALAESPDWRLLRRSEQWELHELLTHSGSYVVVPDAQPVFVRTQQWKEDGLEWLYVPAAGDQFFVLLDPGQDPPAGAVCLSQGAYRDELLRRAGGRTGIARQPVQAATNAVTGEQVTSDRVAFRTSAVGLPHLVKCTYYPNWKVRGARQVFRVTPCFMLVYPEQEQVELYYGRTAADNAGCALSLAGVALLAAWAWRAARARRTRA